MPAGILLFLLLAQAAGGSAMPTSPAAPANTQPTGGSAMPTSPAAPANTQPAPVASLPAETAEIMDGVRSCVNRVVPGDFDPAGFAADGWLPGGRRQARVGGKPVQQLTYGKQSGQVIDIVQITEHLSTSCITLARLKSAGQAAEIRAVIASEFQAQSFDAFQGDDAFKAFVLRTMPASKDLNLLTARHRFLVELVGGASTPTIRILTTPKRAEP